MKPDAPRTLEALVGTIRAAIQREDLEVLTSERLLDALPALEKQGDRSAAIDAIQQMLRAAQRWQTLLQELSEQAQREVDVIYSDKWWEQQQVVLEATFQDDPVHGLQQWLALFTEALLDWELDFCQTMLDEAFDFPPEALTGIRSFSTGIEAILDERPSDALDMLTQLADATPLGAPQPLDNDLRGLLYVRIGQIYLYDKAQPGAARAQLSLGQMLAPDDGRIDAALGDYHRVQDETDQAERFYQQAIERAPAHPEGYVGLGMLAEQRGWWDEATDWYAQAITKVSGARTIDIAVWRVLGFIEAPGDYPDRLRQRIRGSVAEHFDEKITAATAYYEAGIRYHWRQESMAAVSLLRKAKELDDTQPATYWQLADALLSTSYRPTPPYVEAPMIRESIRVWDEGTERGYRPGAGQAWSYVSRALANEQLERLPDSPLPTQLWWESITLCERALLLSETYSYGWSYLSRFHHNLEHEATALHALDRAFDLAPDVNARLAALTEKVIILADAGYLEEAADVANAYLDVLPEMRSAKNDRPPDEQPTEASSPAKDDTSSEPWPDDEVWIRGVQAFVLLYSGEYRKSLDISNRLVVARPEDIWNREIRAMCHRRLGRIDEAIADYYQIWQFRDDEAYADQHTTIGSAAYALFLLGAENARFVDDAIDLYHAVLEKDTTSAVYRNLGLCYLAKGDITNGEYYLIKGIQRTMNDRELDELRDIDLVDLLHYSAHWTYHQDVRRSLDGILLPVIQERYAHIANKLTTIEELQQCLDTALYNDPTGGWMRIGAQAGLARLYTEKAQWDKAAEAYQELRNETRRFPEAVLGLQIVAGALRDLGDTQLRAGNCDQARYDFEQALALDAYPADDSTQGGRFTQFSTQADLNARLGLCQLDMDQESEARTSFLEALRLYESDLFVKPGDALGATCRDLLRDTAHFWKVDAGWAVWENAGTLPHINDARARLLDYLNNRYQLAREAPDGKPPLPVATPIVLELGGALIPEDTGPEWPLLKTYLPAMRERIKKTMGMPVPGVRVRDNTNLAPESYVIQLHEVPVANGSTSAGERFTPASPAALDAAGLHDVCFTAATNPVTGAPGCWIIDTLWYKVTAAGFDLWDDALDFVVRHLEFVLCHNLAEFLGVQEVNELLDTWATNEENAALINTFLTEPDAQRRFARVLRALVAEGVPITQPHLILEAARDAGLDNDDAAPAVRVVRQRLVSQLPGNAPRLRPVVLPADLEATLTGYIQHRAGKTFFALPPETTQAVVQALHNLIEPDDRDAVLVTRSSELRPYLQRLVSIEFPALPLLAQDEITAEVNDHA